ncbi:MAG: ATP-binding cassette domain-containing protein [Treponema sp.]|nr:ATP-binding cassette domain-containing protein [Treponema sp.]
MGKTNVAGGKKTGFLTYLLSFFLFIVGWQLLSLAASAPLILPGPLAVLSRLAFLCQTAGFYRHIGATMGRVFLSFAISIVVGSGLGLVCGRFPVAGRIISAPLAAVRSVPVVSFILLTLLWFGSSSVPVLVAVVMALPVVLTAVATGFSSVPRSLLDAAHTYFLSPWQRFRYARLPFLLAFVREASLSSFGMAWKVVAAGEVLSLPRFGAGQLLYTAQVHLESADLLAVTFAIVFLSFGFEKGAALLFSLKRLTACAKPHVPPADSLPSDGSIRRQEGRSPRMTLAGFSASRGGKQLYRDFSLELAPASSTAIIAPSGAGKTTLLCYMASLLTAGDGDFSGTVGFAGDGDADLSEQEAGRPRISFLFQDSCLFPACTVYENVLLPLLNLMDPKQAALVAVDLLEKCGLRDKWASKPDELSGGERQRAALARAFAFPSSVMLLDEPFQSQDLAQKVALMDLFQRLLEKSPRTVLLVTHDIREALSCCSRIVVLKGSPLCVELDEPLAATGGACADLYLSPDGNRRKLEELISGILLGGPNSQRARTDSAPLS